MEQEKDKSPLNRKLFNERLYVVGPELIDDRDYLIETRQDILKHLDWEHEYESFSASFRIQEMRIASRLEQWPESVSPTLKAAYEKNPVPNGSRVSSEQLHFMKNLVSGANFSVETLKGLIHSNSLGLYKYEPNEDRYEDANVKTIEADDIENYYIAATPSLQENISEKSDNRLQGGDERMTTYQEEQRRQETQKAFQELIQDTDHITLAKRAPLAAYDRDHTPAESLEMRLEAITAVRLESKEANPLLDLQSDYLAALATVGSEQDKQDYLDNEKAVLESLAYPEAMENEFTR